MVHIRHIAVGCPLVVGQCRCLSVGLVTDVTRVWFVVRMDYMVLVKTGVFCKALVTADHLANIWPLP